MKPPKYNFSAACIALLGLIPRCALANFNKPTVLNGNGDFALYVECSIFDRIISLCILLMFFLTLFNSI
jgi:hypothetical protein